MNSERHLLEEQRLYAAMEFVGLYTPEERRDMQAKLVREILDREIILWALAQQKDRPVE